MFQMDSYVKDFDTMLYGLPAQLAKTLLVSIVIALPPPAAVPAFAPLIRRSQVRALVGEPRNDDRLVTKVAGLFCFRGTVPRAEGCISRRTFVTSPRNDFLC